MHFTSPVKSRTPKRKTQTMASSAWNLQAKKKRLDAELAALLSEPSKPLGLVSEDWDGMGSSGASGDMCVDNNTASGFTKNSPMFDVGLDLLHAHNVSNKTEDVQPTVDAAAKEKRLTPDQAALRLCTSWKALLPTLTDDLLGYYDLSSGKPLQAISLVYSEACPDGTCTSKKSTNILCLYFDRTLLVVMQ